MKRNARDPSQVPFVLTPSAKASIIKGLSKERQQRESSRHALTAMLHGYHPAEAVFLKIRVRRSHILQARAQQQSVYCNFNAFVDYIFDYIFVLRWGAATSCRRVRALYLIHEPRAPARYLLCLGCSSATSCRHAHDGNLRTRFRRSCRGRKDGATLQCRLLCPSLHALLTAIYFLRCDPQDSLAQIVSRPEEFSKPLNVTFVSNGVDEEGQDQVGGRCWHRKYLIANVHCQRSLLTFVSNGVDEEGQDQVRRQGWQVSALLISACAVLSIILFDR